MSKILSLPSDINPRSVKFGIKYNNNIKTSPITRVSQIISNNIAQWHGELFFTPIGISDFYKLQNFILLLEGRKNCFYFNIPQAHLLKKPNSLFKSKNKNFDSFKLNAQISKDSTSLIAVISSNSTEILYGKISPGVIFSVNDELKVASSVSKSGNNFNIDFYPKMKKDTAKDSVIRFIEPRGVFRLSRDEVSFLSDEFNNHTLSFSFEEDY